MALKVEIENEPAAAAGETRPKYVGYATPNSPFSAPVWRILFITYDASDSPTSVTYPQVGGIASDDFIFVWNNRGTYTYN